MTRPTHSFSWLRGVIRPTQLATGTPTPGYVVVTNGTTQVWTNPSTIGGGGGGGGGGGWITDGTAGTMLEPGRTYISDANNEASIYMPGDGEISIDGGSGAPGVYPEVWISSYNDIRLQADRVRIYGGAGLVLPENGSDPTSPTPLAGQMYFDPYGAHGRVRVYDTSSGWYTLEPDKTYVHNQSVASASWDFFHNLEKYPAVTVVDTGGNEVIGTIHHVDPYHVQITFSAAFSGKAYCN